MRVVLDTNTVISALLWKGTPRNLLATIRERGDVRLYSSPKLLAELAEVLSRKKMTPAVAASNETAEQLLRRYMSLIRIVTPANVPAVIATDPDDDHILACAVEGGADLIVSGDRHLLGLGGQYQGIRIVTPAEAVGIVTAR